MFLIRVFPVRMFRFCIMHKISGISDYFVTVQYIHSCEPQAHLILKAQILIHKNNLETSLHP